jgi:hypothetical protein
VSSCLICLQAISLKNSNSFNLKIYLYGVEKYMSELPTPIESIRVVPTEGPREANFNFIRTSDDLHQNFLLSSDRGSSGSKFPFHPNFRSPIKTSDNSLTPISGLSQQRVLERLVLISSELPTQCWNFRRPPSEFSSFF